MNPKILDQVPWDAVMPSGPQYLFIALAYLIAALALWFVVAEIKRRQDWVPLYAFIGGGLSVFYEGLGDILACVLYPIHGQIGWIDLFGRSIPMYIGVIFFWYMSVPAIYFLRRLESGFTKATWWRGFWLFLAIAVGIEIYGVSQGTWIYYGSPAYVLFGVPIWAPVTYAGFTMTNCIGLQLMATQLDRRYHWLIMLGIPMFMAGGHVVVSLPAAAAQLTTSDPFWIWLGATGTIALTIGLAWVMSLIYCSDSKVSAASRPASAKPATAAK